MITEYKGLTVAQITELRDSLRKAGVEYKVVKNTLAGIASSGTGMSPLAGHLKGTTGLAITTTDVAAMAKAVLEFSKKNEKLVVKGAVMDGAYYDQGKVKAIAELPSREVLLSMMAGTFQAPASKMARLLSATVARFGYALHALKDKKAAA